MLKLLVLNCVKQWKQWKPLSKNLYSQYKNDPADFQWGYFFAYLNNKVIPKSSC